MTAALIGFGVMLLLMLTGLPIGFAMLSVGFVGYALMTNIDAAFGLLSLVPFDQVAVYSMSVIPLFCLMGEFGFRSGVVADAYVAADKWVGHHRGGLCMATNVACAAFAAMTGSSIAGSSIMTQVAWPEMKKKKYKATLALGCIAAGGTLGIMIPPSTPMITYGIITNSSVGSLFLAGVLPGIIITVLFCIAVVVVTRIDKDAAPGSEKSSWKERFVSLKKVWLLLLLIVAVLGSIWGGFCSPTEAAAIGSFGTFLISLARKNMSVSIIRACLKSSMKVTAMIFFLLIGASVFSNFITVTKAPGHNCQLGRGEQHTPRAGDCHHVLRIYLPGLPDGYPEHDTAHASHFYSHRHGAWLQPHLVWHTCGPYDHAWLHNSAGGH